MMPQPLRRRSALLTAVLLIHSLTSGTTKGLFARCAIFANALSVFELAHEHTSPRCVWRNPTHGALTKLSASTQAEARRIERLTPPSRRDIISKSFFLCWSAAGMVSSYPQISHADDDEGGDPSDLTTQLFNADGSLRAENALKRGVTGEALSRTIEVNFPSSSPAGSRFESENGGKVDGADDSSVRVRYELPQKWSEKGYLDLSEGINARACDRISIFQVRLGAGSNDSMLKNAAGTGVDKTLQVRYPGLSRADLVGGRRRKSDDVNYYEFDLAVAPTTCAERGRENLGLGFCPYDSIVLLSSAIVDDALYVFQLECNKDEWKLFNSDLKRVRESFLVTD